MATKYWISSSSTSFNTAANWSDTAAPANSDTLIFNNLGTANCITNVSTSLTGVTVIVEKSYTGNIGVLSGATATYLVLDGGTLIVGQSSGMGSGSGSPLIMVNFGATAGVVNIYDSASVSSDTYHPPILVKGNALTVNQYGGSTGVCALPGETGTTFTGHISPGDSPAVSPALFLGTGTVTTALTANTGEILSHSNQTQTTLTITGDAEYFHDGTGAHTTLNLDGKGKCIYAGTGTLSTLNAYGGTLDRTKDTRAVTISTQNLYAGCAVLYDNGAPASTTRSTVNLVGCGMQDITVSTPLGEKL